MPKPQPELLIRGAQIVSPLGSSPICGEEMRHLRVINEGWIACSDGKILGLGPMDELVNHVTVDGCTEIIDAAGKVVLPGLVDPHTHLVFGGSREDEFYLRAQGTDYMEIMTRGEVFSARSGPLAQRRSKSWWRQGCSAWTGCSAKV